MDEYLSDRQLNISTWLYTHKTSLSEVILFILAATAVVVFIMLFVNTLLFLSKINSHQTRMIQTTADLVLRVDPSTKFLPLPVDIEEIRSIIQPRGGVDFIAKILNPNPEWLAFSFDYHFIVDGDPLPSKTAFVLPEERNYLVSYLPGKSYFQTVDLDWENLRWYKSGARGDQEKLELLDISVLTSTFEPGSDDATVDSVEIEVLNNTPFGFWEVNLIALVYNARGQLLAVGEGKIDNFLFKQKRSINIGLGYLDLMEEEEVSVEIIPQVNILDQSNILYL